MDKNELFEKCLDVDSKIEEFSEYINEELNNYKKSRISEFINSLKSNENSIKNDYKKEVVKYKMKLNMLLPIVIDKMVDDNFEEFNSELICEIEKIHEQIYECKLDRHQTTNILKSHGFTPDAVKDFIFACNKI